MKSFFSRDITLLLLFALAGFVFGWPLITLPRGGQEIAAYLTAGAVLILVALFVADRVRATATDEEND